MFVRARISVLLLNVKILLCACWCVRACCVCVCTLVAAALAMQIAEGFVAIFFTLLITSVVTYLNKVKKVDPRY